MADSCIICLEDLDALHEPGVHDDPQDAGEVAVLTPPNTTSHPGNPDNAKDVALLKPCNHVLHDHCIKLWSQTANSCPICRQQFNLVQVLDKIGGTILSEYEVENKKQVAEFDPSAWIEEDDEEEEEEHPCPICGESNEPEVLLLCDACDAPYHTHCIGLERVPSGNWFCMECTTEGAYLRAAELPPSATRRLSRQLAPRTQASARRSRQRLRNDHWQGPWSLFSNRIHSAAGIDLDFLDDESEQPMNNYRQFQGREDNELRERRQWQRRFDIAQNQGAGDAFRESVPTRHRLPIPQAPVETVEETRAWGALDRAKKVDASTPRNNKRKSRSITSSPAESTQPQEPERKLKRPRTRRVVDNNSDSAAGSSSMAGTSRYSNGYSRAGSPASRILNGRTSQPSFLSNLLKEVEMASASDDDRSAISNTTRSGLNRVTSPSLEYSSPAASPTSSTSYHTPRESSITPPPNSKRSSSPLSLTSRVEARYPPAAYSPNRSPPDRKSEHHRVRASNGEIQQPRARRQNPAVLTGSGSTSAIHTTRSVEISPIRATMTAEAKENINQIVKNALKPHWRAAEISKEQYADINRDVSRKLYEIVADPSTDDERQKSAWEKIATSEVATAVKSMTA